MKKLLTLLIALVATTTQAQTGTPGVDFPITATLESVTATGGTLIPTFQPEVTNYILYVPTETWQVSLDVFAGAWQQVSIDEAQWTTFTYRYFEHVSYPGCVNGVTGTIDLPATGDKPIRLYASGGPNGRYTHVTYTITVTRKNPGETRTVTARKVWDDGDNLDGIRPERIWFVLKRQDGVEITTDAAGNPLSPVMEIAGTGGSNLTATWENLPKWKQAADGTLEEIPYTVVETATQSYLMQETPAGYTSIIAGDMAGGFTITNRHVPKQTDIIVTKAWDDNGNAAGERPETVTLHLDQQPFVSAEGVDNSIKDVRPAVVVSEDNGWRAEWYKLPMNERAFGSLSQNIRYLIREDAEGYTAKLVQTDAGLRATIVWDEGFETPEGITATLCYDGDATSRTANLNAANNWTAQFDGIPMNKVDQYSVNCTLTSTQQAASSMENAVVKYYTLTNTPIPVIEMTFNAPKCGVKVDEDKSYPMHLADGSRDPIALSYRPEGSILTEGWEFTKSEYDPNVNYLTWRPFTGWNSSPTMIFPFTFTGGNKSWVRGTLLPVGETPKPAAVCIFVNGEELPGAQINLHPDGQVSFAVQIAAVHELEEVRQVLPTYETPGTAAYWTCTGCGKLFSDEHGANEIDAPVEIPTLNYSLWVGNTPVDGNNKDNILGNGTAKYDPETNTLTLNEPEITTLNTESAAIYYSGDDPLTIEGKATLDVEGAEFGIRVGNAALTIHGDITAKGLYQGISVPHNSISITGGNVYSEATNINGYNHAIYTEYDFTFSGDSLTVLVTNGQSVGISAAGSVTFTAGVVDIRARHTGIHTTKTISIENGMKQMYVLGQYSAMEAEEGITVGEKLCYRTQTAEFPYAYGIGISDDGKYIVQDGGKKSPTVLLVGQVVATLSFNPAAPNTITFNDEFTEPELVVEPVEAKDAVLTYSKWTSNDERVAKVDAEGNVTILGTGTATITISFPGTADFEAAETSYTLTVDQAEAGLSYNEAEYDGKHGEDFTAPMLNNPNSLTVTFESNDESVAMVNASTGEVTLVGEGTATITATFAGDDNYLPGKASYIIHVAPHNGILINEEYFPDDIFRQYVSDYFDRDGDGWLEEDEAMNAKQANVSNMGIEDLTGVEHLTGLTMLDCSYNRLTKLHLQSNTQLSETRLSPQLLTLPALPIPFDFIGIGILLRELSNDRVFNLKADEQPLEMFSRFGYLIVAQTLQECPNKVTYEYDTLNPNLEEYMQVIITVSKDFILTGVETPHSNSNKEHETVYSLDGKQYNTQPTHKGVYIQRGRKVIIK